MHLNALRSCVVYVLFLRRKRWSQNTSKYIKTSTQRTAGGLREAVAATGLRLYLQGVDSERLLEAVNALLELLVVEMQQALGTLGSGAAPARQLPRPVIVPMVLQDISQQAVQTRCRLLL